MLLFQNKTTRAEIVKPAFLLLKFLALNISVIIDFAVSFPFIFVKNLLHNKNLNSIIYY